MVCDRFTDSTYAYQGAGKGLPVRDIAALEKMVLGRARPQLTLVLDVKPETGLARAKSRGDANRFEDETLAFARRVRACFLARAKAAPARYAVLNANRDAGAVTRALTKLLEQRL